MYEEKFDKVDISIKGKAIVSIVEPTIYMNYPTSGKGISFNGTNQRIGYLTGNWTTKDNLNYFQVEFENDFTLDGEVYHWGAANAAQFRLVDMGSDSGAKQMINNLIANNQTILENNLLCAGMISHMETNSVTVPVSHRTALYALQSRLSTRNEKILNSAFIESKQTASPQGFSQYGQQLTNFMNNPGIGILPVVIYIVSAVVITLLTTAVIMLLFKTDYTDSKSDLVVSKDLTKALATLSPEARAAALADLNGQVDEAYVKGKTDGSGSGILKTVTYLAAGFLGFTLIDKFILNKK